MTDRFKPIWDGSRRKPAGSGRSGVTSAQTDTESGTDEDRTDAGLRALDVMLERGLMSRAEYDKRRAALLGKGGGGGD